MGSFSIWHLLVVIVVVMLLFGKGRLSGTMEDLAHGIKAFKKGMKEDHDVGLPTNVANTPRDVPRAGELPRPIDLPHTTETDKTTLPRE